MILFLLSTFALSEPLKICIYNISESNCSSIFYSYQFDVNNFQEFIDADIPTAETIIFDFFASPSLHDTIDTSRFNDTLKNISFRYSILTPGIPIKFTISSTSNSLPSVVELRQVQPYFDIDTNFSTLSLEEAPITIKGNNIIAETLNTDSLSLKNVETITSDRIIYHSLFNGDSKQKISAKSFSDQSTLNLVEIGSVMLTTNIIYSSLAFQNEKNATLFTLDLEEWTGIVNVTYGSLMENLFTIECLAYSPLHKIPFLSINFRGRFIFSESNWPMIDEPLLEVRCTDGPSLFSNTITVSGFIPAHVFTGSSSLSLSPRTASSGFMKLTIEGQDVNINQILDLTENYYFYINEIVSTKDDGNITVNASPPLMYVAIDKLVVNQGSKAQFELRGTANYVLKNLPNPGDGFMPTVFVEHLWFENNVTFDYNLQDGAPNIRVLDYVLMKTWPTYFIPNYIGNSTEKVAQKKFKLICAKLLKEQKEELMLPASGFPRGFNRGAAVVHRYYEQDPDTTATLKCFGMDVNGDVNSVSNVFCFADDATKEKCPPESQLIGTGDNWRTFVADDAGQLTFFVFRSAELEFDGFTMVNVSVVGQESPQKVMVHPANVDHLSLTNVDVTFSEASKTTIVDLTSSTLAGRYQMGPLATDTSSLKTIDGRNEFDVQVTVKDVSDTKITVTKDGAVNLQDSQVEFKVNMSKPVGDDDFPGPSAFILVDEAVSNILFTFEEGAGRSIVDNTIVVKFANQTNVSFNGLAHASRFFVLDNFSGVLDFGKESTIPIDLINDHDITFQTDPTITKLTFESELDLYSKFSSDHEIECNHVRVLPGASTSVNTSIAATNFAVLKEASATMKSLNVRESLVVYPGSYLNVQSTQQMPEILNLHYTLSDMPSIFIGANKNNDNKYAPKQVVFEYIDTKYNTAVIDKTSCLENGIEMISGNGLDCSNTKFDFESPYAFYYGIYSILEARCVGQNHDSIKLFLSSNATKPPEPTPLPLVPTATAVPNNTRKQVIIISVTVVTFFLIIVIVIIKCMNKKKKYVSKKKDEVVNLNSNPLIDPNAE